MYSFVGDTRRWDAFTLQDSHTYAIRLHNLFPDRRVQLTCIDTLWAIVVSYDDGKVTYSHYIMGIGDYADYLEVELLKR